MRSYGADLARFSEYDSPRDQFLEGFSRYKTHRSEFHELDYREYFSEKHAGIIGFYYYDGEHSEENQYRGLKAAEPYLADNALIFIDDANEEAVINGTNRYLKETDFKFRLIARYKTGHDTHPTFWNGLIIMQREA